LAGWDDEVPGDYLRTYDHLAAFAAGWELVDDEVAAALREVAATRRGAARGALEAAREFRTSLYRVLTRPEPGADIELVAETVRRAAQASELALHGDRFRWTLPASAGLRVPLLAVAHSADDLLTSGQAASVGRCPGESCGWLFLDRGGRRRWCTMSTCGNRAKARRFSDRRRERGTR
jgi:predicted RNA-binding Zn ribbon-like protein